MVTVIATIQSKAGKENETALLLRGLLSPTRSEPGCNKYLLHRRKDNPRMFYFVESWATPEALQTHLNSAHIKQAMARGPELLESIDIAEVDPFE